MRKIKVKYIITFCGLLLQGMVLCQNILTVSNITGEGQYTDLQLAINSAQPNDIILVYSGSYGNITIDRPLSIYGPGYRIPENPSLQISTFRLNAFVNTITFLASSSGSLISGFYADKFIINNASNILIKRNYFYHQGIGYNSTMSNCSALVLEGNNFYISQFGNSDNTSVQVSVNCSGIIVRNNIFNAFYPYQAKGIAMNGGISSQIIFKNNYTNVQHRINNSEIFNNIMTAPNGQWNPGGTNNYITNNMIGVAGGTFVTGTYSFDAQYQLAVNSPAQGAGVNGVDLGIFGGTTPYKLSGIPDLPLIYELNVPDEANGSINVNIKVRAEK